MRRLAEPWQALIGAPFAEFACAPLVREVYRLAGRPLPADAFLPGSGAWERVGADWRAARQLLDVIASDPEGTGVESHVSVVVREPETGLLRAITTSMNSGCVLVRLSAVQRVMGIFRLHTGRPGGPLR